MQGQAFTTSNLHQSIYLEHLPLMPLVNLTLSDLLATVPHLLASCLPKTKHQLTNIKALRLVSKDVGCAAMTVVTTCAVQLGQRVCLEVEQIVGLMSQQKLQSLIVTVVVATGKHLGMRLSVGISKLPQIQN